MALWEFRGLTPYVGAALVVALVWAGTRPALTIRSPREIPKTRNFYIGPLEQWLRLGVFVSR